MLTGNKDLNIKILNNLEDRDLVNFFLTNRYFYNLGKNKYLWMNRILDRFSCLGIDIIKKYKEEKTWKQYYVDLVSVTMDEKQLIINAQDGRLDKIIVGLELGIPRSELEGSVTMACLYGQLEVVRYLSEHYNVNNNNSVVIASSNGYIEIVKYLVENGADIHIFNNFALIQSSRYGYIEIVKYLVENGADIYAANNFALRLASKEGHIEVVKYLVENGANIYAENQGALRWAQNQGHTEIVNYLRIKLF